VGDTRGVENWSGDTRAGAHAGVNPSGVGNAAKNSGEDPVWGNPHGGNRKGKRLEDPRGNNGETPQVKHTGDTSPVATSGVKSPVG
jgi:hypothetical protein